MIIPATLFVLIGTTLQISHIPASFANSVTTCRLEFDAKVRKVYPEYNIVTGEQFIAQYDQSSCSIISRQKHEASSCADATTACSDDATSVIRINNTTLHYCYSDNEAPKAMTATLLPNGTYSYSSGGLMFICLSEASKHSFASLNPSDEILYVASDSNGRASPWLIYYSLPDQKTQSLVKTSDSFYDVLGMFTRGDFLYTVYQEDNKRKTNRITRSCKTEQTNEMEIVTYMFTEVFCTETIEGQDVKLDRILAVEFSPTQDKLFILTTQYPVSSAPVYVCALNITQDIDRVFDTTQFYGLDERGSPIKESNPGKIDCSKSWQYPSLTEAVDPVTTSNVVLRTQYTNIFTFSTYDTIGNLFFYLMSQNSLYVYDLTAPATQGRLLSEMVLMDPPRTISIADHTIYLTSDSSVTMMPTTWCSFYGQDPVSCIAARDPSCSYSKEQSRCLPSEQCTESDGCVQDLENGSFSSLFPNGYTFRALGTVCIHEMFFADISYTYFPNASYTFNTSYRDCVDRPVTTAPVINQSMALSTRELTFMIGMIVAVAGCLVLVMVYIIRGNTRLCHVSPSANEKSHSGKPLPPLSEDKIPPQTPDRPVICPDAHHIVHVLPSVDICKSLQDQMRQTAPNSNTVRTNSSDDKRAIVDPGTPLSTADPRIGMGDPLSMSEFDLVVRGDEHTVVYKNKSAEECEEVSIR